MIGSRHRPGSTLAAIGLSVSLAGLACGHAEPPKRSDVGDRGAVDEAVCRRLRDAMRSTSDRELRVALPAAAGEATLLAPGSGAVSGCGDELLASLVHELSARPIDLTRGLQPRIEAVGALLAGPYQWAMPATDLLGALLLEPSEPIAHFGEVRTCIPESGACAVVGKRVDISLDDLDRWLAHALRRGWAERTFEIGSSRAAPSDRYADLLVRVFRARYDGPRPRITTPGEPKADAARESLPEPKRLGCGSAALDVLWPDLVRAFRAAPKHERWQDLPPEIADRLHGPEAPPCG